MGTLGYLDVVFCFYNNHCLMLPFQLWKIELCTALTVVVATKIKSKSCQRQYYTYGRLKINFKEPLYEDNFNHAFFNLLFYPLF